MSHLKFSVSRAGLIVPVWIGLDGKTTSALFAQGKPIVPPVQCTGLLDTGTDVTAVASWILKKLGLPPSATAVTQTAGGLIQVNLYDISLSITQPNIPGSPWLTLSDLLVTELGTVLPDVDVLIGLNVFSECKFLLDGPAKQFQLEF